MIVHDVLQRSPEWRALRLGKLTGSSAADMMARIKSGEAAARRDLRMRLVCERLTGQSQEDDYQSKAMERGVALESAALAAYEAATGQIVQAVGFVEHDTLPAGCSPDGRVEDFRGLVEIKCPKSATHLRYLHTGRVPTDYLWQILHNLWITGAEWCDFVSYDDRFPPSLQLLIVRVARADVDVVEYTRNAREFLDEVAGEHAALLARSKAA